MEKYNISNWRMPTNEHNASPLSGLKDTIFFLECVDKSKIIFTTQNTQRRLLPFIYMPPLIVNAIFSI